MANAQNAPAPAEGAAPTTINASELPHDSTIVTDEVAIRWLNSTWRSFIRKNFNVEPDGYPLVQVYKTGPRSEEVIDGKKYFVEPMSFVYQGDKTYCICNAYGILISNNTSSELHYGEIGTDENTVNLEVVGEWKPKPKADLVKVVQDQFEATFKAPINKADIPTSNWNGPKLEPQLKKLMEKQGFKIVKIIIRSDTWSYKRNKLGVILSRSVSFDFIHEGKTEDGKKAFFYRPGYSASQANNGKDFDKTLVLDGVPFTDNHLIPDWK